MSLQWREDPGQKCWLWVGLIFLGFYFAEAFLFWGPEPRVAAPPNTPLMFWGLFGACLIWVITRPVAKGPLHRWERVQSVALGVVITATVVGSAFLVIRRTGDLALGHAVLMFTLGQAGFVVGAMSFNPGWLTAGLSWILVGAWVLGQPAAQDYIIGGGVGVGFVLIGCLRKSLVRSNDGSEQF